MQEITGIPFGDAHKLYGKFRMLLFLLKQGIHGSISVSYGVLIPRLHTCKLYEKTPVFTSVSYMLA